MRAQESRKHHYVPEFLLRAWACGGTLNGYWWDARRRALACKRLGPKAFCRELDLLLLKRHPEGRDTLENRFFGGVDTRGARARDRILEAGPRALSEDERCDLVRLLFSLEVRSPATIESIRAAVTQLVESMDGDRELLDAMEREGECDAPSDRYAKQHDHTMGDRFLVNVIQHLVDNARIGGKLINACWTLVRLSERNGTLVLSDRPVVRLRERGAWFLPLEPKSALAVLPRDHTIDSNPAHRVAKRLNVESARQALKYVFAVESGHERLLSKHLAPSGS